MTRYVVLFALVASLSACTRSVRLPEVGPDTTPIGIPRISDIDNVSLPALVSQPIAANDTTVVPVFQPERLMVWHIQGYTKNNAMFIGPHTVVLKIEPGRFMRELDSDPKIPVAAKFITIPDRVSQLGNTASEKLQKLDLPNVDNLPEAVKSQIEAIQKTPGE